MSQIVFNLIYKCCIFQKYNMRGGWGFKVSLEFFTFKILCQSWILEVLCPKLKEKQGKEDGPVDKMSTCNICLKA